MASQGGKLGEETGHEEEHLAEIIATPAVQSVIQRIVDEMVKKNALTPPKGEDTDKKPLVIDPSGLTAKLKPEDIGYFDPTAEGEGDIVNAGKYVVYKDVYQFKERLETCVAHWKDEEVRKLILAYLRGDTLKWHSNELSDDKKLLLARAVDSSEWIEALIKRFKMKTSTALSKLHLTSYRYSEVRRGILARQHANNILKFAKSAEIDSIKN